MFDEHTREVDYEDKSVTENTRAAYPIEYISNAKMPCVGPHPRNVILLACDAFGVLPPVSKLTLAQTMYHFISGYTALVAGTEDGIKEPQATFSACFGAAFIMLHPTKYAAMLAQKMEKHNATGWLVNTGWSGGRYAKSHTSSIPNLIIYLWIQWYDPRNYFCFQVWSWKSPQVGIYKKDNRCHTLG